MIDASSGCLSLSLANIAVLGWLSRESPPFFPLLTRGNDSGGGGKESSLNKERAEEGHAFQMPLPMPIAVRTLSRENEHSLLLEQRQGPTKECFRKRACMSVLEAVVVVPVLVVVVHLLAVCLRSMCLLSPLPICIRKVGLAAEQYISDHNSVKATFILPTSVCLPKVCPH